MSALLPFSTPVTSTSISIDNNVPKLCLNMIVKNESKVILRLLESVVNIIDTYCICDTGSTDNTVELITNFFKLRAIPGKIIYEPFQDFGYNRTFAAKACEEIPNADYLLLLDADMILTGDALIPVNTQAFKKNLTSDCYHICQGSPQYYYKNVRIMRNYRGYSYWGVTHEYVSTPSGTNYDEVPIGTLFINDIGDGGAKTDKFERDIRLLTKGLEENPNNDRYTFYLANSLRDAGRTDEAIETFRKRIDIGGWIEEVWHSHYNIGNCYMHKGEPEKAISAWLEAFQAHPKRIESLYKVINYYREKGHNQLAYLYFVAAESSRKRWGASNDYLFLQKDVYDYKIDYEMSIIGYYVNHDQFDLSQISLKVLSYPHLSDSTGRNVLSNYKFYSSKLVDIQSNFNQPFLTTATDSLIITADGTFVKSTPSLILRGNHLIVNVRYVNYRIDDNGNYVNQSHIITKNAIAVIDISKPIWKTVQEFELDYDKSNDGRYVGLEDVRIFLQKDSILYNANRGIPDDTMTVEHGEISLSDESTKNSKWPKTANHHGIEKNWVLLPGDKKSPRVIYHWNPDLIIGKFENDKFVETHRKPVPALFKYLRGSTNGVVIKDEIWLICHVVSYEDRRYYYHIVVVLDKTSYEVKRYTTLFTFEGAKVEYTLGFVYLEKDDQLLIGYSVYDKSAKYISVGRNEFENRMIQNS